MTISSLDMLNQRSMEAFGSERVIVHNGANTYSEAVTFTESAETSFSLTTTASAGFELGGSAKLSPSASVNVGPVGGGGFSVGELGISPKFSISGSIQGMASIKGTRTFQWSSNVSVRPFTTVSVKSFIRVAKDVPLTFEAEATITAGGYYGQEIVAHLRRNRFDGKITNVGARSVTARVTGTGRGTFGISSLTRTNEVENGNVQPPAS
jgi:hypothetical protein